jgi:threonine dehydrogenase-like Zn-dependent dehydrogenase
VRRYSAVLDLEGQGRLALRELISHLVPADEAPSAFKMLDVDPQSALQVVLDYRQRA